MIASTSQYILAVKHLDKMSRNLGNKHIYPIFEEGSDDKLRCSLGNSVIVFEVMCEGRKTGELDISEATQEKIMQLATMREEN